MKGSMKPIFWTIAILIAAISFQSRTALAACSSPSGTAGTVVYNSTHKTFQYCNDTNWIAMNTKPGSGSGGCTNPASDEGSIVYNEDYRVLQGCAGNVYRAFGVPNPASSRWVGVSNFGGATSCGVKADHSAWCKGYDSAGQLGNDLLTQDTNHLVRVAGGNVWKSISTANGWGNGVTCGIRIDETLWCWGDNTFGQVGNGAPMQNEPLPVRIGTDTWKMVSVNTQACGIKTDNTLWCWGNDDYGQVGNGGGTGTEDTPVQVAPGTFWKHVAANNVFTCGIKTDDTAWCWGNDDYGQLGNGGTSGNQDEPSPVSGGHTWKTISLVWGGTACGIKSDDTVWCWGTDNYGRLGNGDPEADSDTPVQVSGGGTWQSISGGESGDSYFCGVKSGGTYWCWGYYDYNTHTSPDQIHTDTDWAVAQPPCGLKTNGSLWCSGSGDLFGYVGYLYQQNVPTLTSEPGPWKSIWPTYCVTANDDTASCWSSPEGPIPLAGGAAWKEFTRYCGIRTDGTGWCWGLNYSGQLGNGTIGINEPDPVQISGGGTWKKLARQDILACGIKSDDSLWCWGDDSAGQVGNGAPTNSYSTPQAISGGGSWKDIDVGTEHACGIKSDDTLWCWGTDVDGRLGNGAAGSQNAPMQVSGGGSWLSVHVGGYHSCALKSDSTLWCWGSDSVGQLGNGAPTSDVTIPAQVGTDTWYSISTTGALVCGLKSDKTAWCWGNNWLGQTGTGSTAPVTSPTRVKGEGTWDQLKVMGWDDSACGLSKGLLYCWGFNDSGQTLVATYSEEMIPAQCDNPPQKLGALVYNSAANLLQYCNGSDWIAMGKSDIPSDPPIPPSKKIFVTSTVYQGDFGGQSGGDAICAARATAGGLSGTYVAWISQSGGGDTISRMSAYSYHYVRTDGIKIANNFNDLTDGMLDAAIDKDEFGNNSAATVWTGTDEYGYFADGGTGNCTDFSSNAGGQYGMVGITGSTVSDWSNDTLGRSCNSTFALYCIEQ